MYIYVLYVSCFAFFWGTNVGIYREVFPARHKGGMMHHHHSCRHQLAVTRCFQIHAVSVISSVWGQKRGKRVRVKGI